MNISIATLCKLFSHSPANPPTIVSVTDGSFLLQNDQRQVESVMIKSKSKDDASPVVVVSPGDPVPDWFSQRLTYRDLLEGAQSPVLIHGSALVYCPAAMSLDSRGPYLYLGLEGYSWKHLNDEDDSFLDQPIERIEPPYLYRNHWVFVPVRKVE